ncbi:hypothetical protein Bca101_101215 [Brassica carinata]
MMVSSFTDAGSIKSFPAVVADHPTKRSERRSRTDLANDTGLWEPKLLLRVGNRAAGACVASSPDSDLEAFSHNPAHGSFAPLAFQPSAMTNCANQRFLSCAAQPNSPPDNVLRSIDRKRVLGLKEGVVTRLRFTDSELAVRRPGKLPKSRSQSAPPTRGGPLATLAAQAARQQSTGSNWDPEPSPQSQSFSGYGSILPTSLPTLFHRPEAVHLGDLMRYEYDRRERTRSSGFSRAPECTDTTRRGGALPAAGPYLR